MKKIIISTLAIINILTLYFFIFPYQNYGEYNSLQEVFRAFSVQKQLLGTSIEYKFRELSKEVEAYPQFKSNEDLAEQIHEDYREIKDELENFEDVLYEQIGKHYSIPEYGQLPPNDFWFRIQPFHYQIPKNVLFKNGILAEAITTIDENQAIIVKALNNVDFKKIEIDSFLIDTEALPQLLKRKSFMETVCIINKLKAQIKMAEQEIASQLLEITKSKITDNQLKLVDFVPMVSVRNRKIKKGELFEAQIFTAPIMTHDSLKFFINGKSVPHKNGKVNYEYIPKSSGIKRFQVAVELNNSLYQFGNRTYKNEFELYVADCE